jgi:NDP-sugar pyrophosphorylase family protein
MSIKYALIMAAGRGTRMLPLTSSIPKAMAPLNGTTLIANVEFNI